MSTLNIESEHKAIWQDFGRTLKESKRLILTVLFTTVIGVYILLQLMTSVYEVEAQVLVKLGRENTEVPATVEKGGVISSGVRMEEINSEVYLLQSRELIAAAADQIGIERFFIEPAEPETFIETVKYYIKKTARGIKQQLGELLVAVGLRNAEDDRSKVISGLQASLQIDRKKDSDVIGISLRLPDPVLASDILTSLLDLYQDRHVEVRGTNSVQGLFSDRAQGYQDRISALEQRRATLRNKLRLTSVDEEREHLLTRVQKLYEVISDLEREYALLPPIRDTSSAPSSAFSNPSILVIKDRIANLQLDRLNQLRVYEPSAKTITDLDTKIHLLEAHLGDGLKTRLRLLRNQTEDINVRLEELNTGEDKLAVLHREHTRLVESYLLFSKRLEDTQLSQEMDFRRVANIAILSRPQVPSTPIAPNKLKMLILSFPIGLLLGIGLALLRDYLNDTVKSRRDIEAIPALTYLGQFRL